MGVLDRRERGKDSLGVLDRGERDKDNETSLKEGGGIEMSTTVLHIRDASLSSLCIYSPMQRTHQIPFIFVVVIVVYKMINHIKIVKRFR